ncbi:hypothetical protein HDU77_007715 [Chytriomyces hyalinus]|nr:hypothetical protein HDU77_007715 [Chytriomyces hyalinus]
MSDAIAVTCKGSSACQVALQWVVPLMGCVTAGFLFYSPFPAVQRALKEGTIGKLNTIPYALLAANGLVWVLYSFLIQDWFIFGQNCVAWASSLYYTLALFPLSAPKSRLLTGALLIAFTTLIQISAATIFISGISHDTAVTALGLVANVVLVSFYGSPLATCVQVVREKDSSSLEFLLAFATAINGILWTSYGFAINNYYVAVPNGVGVLFALAQLVLIRAYPRKERTAQTDSSDITQVVVASK